MEEKEPTRLKNTGMSQTPGIAAATEQEQSRLPLAQNEGEGGEALILAQKTEIERLKGLLAAEQMKSALFSAGFSEGKAAKIARMIDPALIGTDGVIDPAALKKEIDALLDEFPALRTKEAAEKGERTGFKIGADGRQNKGIHEKIATVFGNQR